VIFMTANACSTTSHRGQMDCLAVNMRAFTHHILHFYRIRRAHKPHSRSLGPPGGFEGAERRRPSGGAGGAAGSAKEFV